MSIQYGITTGSTALVAATAKTVIEVATGTSMAPEWVSFDVSFNGTSATAVPVLCEIVSYTATGTGTTFTPKRVGAATGVAISTAKINDTVEPSTPTVLMAWFVPPTSGFSYQWPLGRELMEPVSSFYGLRLTAPAVVNYVANVVFEE